MTITYGLLSTHPPTHCGLATFNAALSTHLAAAGGCCGVVRMTAHAEDTRPRPEVVHTWLAGQQAGWLDAASVLNGFDVAVVQHEYGIYPGRDGYDVLPLLRHLTIPSIVILHTVLASPTTRQKTLLEQIAATADTVVTMTETARQRLLAGYRVNPGTVTVIPHGAALHADAPTGPRPRPHLLTWGLLGPGKGIEWTLRALALLQDLDPTPTYTVAGRTHPKVLDHDGEAYRDSLHHLSAQLGLAHSVAFDPVYRDEVALSLLIRSADLVVLPYDSREQVTSGVLIEAVAAGVPVVATPFPHAVELLHNGPGLLVPHQDPVALAGAIRRVLTDPGLAAQLVAHARVLPGAPPWPAVAARYEVLAEGLLTDRLSTAAVVAV